METIVEESLGDVQSCHTCRLIAKAVENELMLAQRVDRKIVAVLERLLDVVCTKHSQRAYHADVLLAEHQYICICPEQHTEVAHEA